MGKKIVLKIRLTSRVYGIMACTVNVKNAPIKGHHLLFKCRVDVRVRSNLKSNHITDDLSPRLWHKNRLLIIPLRLYSFTRKKRNHVSCSESLHSTRFSGIKIHDMIWQAWEEWAQNVPRFPTLSIFAITCQGNSISREYSVWCLCMNKRRAISRTWKLY